jgi:WD40 repeat protein
MLSAVLSRDSRRVLTATGDGAVRLWVAGTGQALGPKLPELAGLSYAGFSPDEKLIVTTSTGGTRVWSSETGQPVTPSLPHRGEVRAWL